MFKRTALALAVVACAYTGTIQAQENATLTLRSGERISGQLVDLGGTGFTVRVNNETRTIATNDVAVIDFAGGTMSNADWAKVSDGQHLIWLRSGETVSGQLYDIGGTSPLRLTIKTASGERELSSGEVGRIVLARPTSGVATSGSGTTGSTGSLSETGGTLVVNARQQWTPTGLTVRRGEAITFNTTGDIQLSADTNDVAGAAGARSQRYSPNAPMPRAFAGALIGRIGNGQPFAIGNQTSVTMPAAGQLFIGINDDDVNDNNGEFRVEITRAAPTRRR